MAADIPPLTYRDLELSLDRAGNGLFRVRLRGLGMDRTPPPISLDLDGLAALRDNPGRYGRRLGELLFAAPGLADAFGQAKGSVCAVPGHGLHLRLVIPPDVSELHRLAWETLVVPGDDMPLAMDERVLFSRCLGGQDLLAAPGHNASPKIVAAIANPTDLADPIDVAGELERLRSSLGDLAIAELVDGHATLEYIGAALAEGADVLYLACHGLFDQGTPLLVLENPDRQTALVPGKELAAAVRRLPRKPSLVVLASCQSAGAGEGEVLAATGPLLVDAGVPAVVAMQGNVRIDTVAQWLPAFWRAWRKDGAVDRAAAAARWAVRERPDWWMPVAFVRLPAEQPAPKRRRADFYRHIDLPPHYVPRPSLLAEIKQTLLAEHDAGKPVALTSAVMANVDALHGMGGIGKTVAARALCDDPDVQAAYPDGILWATVSQTPDLIPQLRDWIRELGGIVSEYVPTVASLKNLLAELLAERACLLVVDDVWSVKDAQVFLVPAPGCRVVMTTRDAAVANEVGAAVQRVPLMALEEAVELLRAWSGDGLDRAASEQVISVVERLGRLPLAIKLAGPQLQETEPATWLQEFDVRNLEARRGNGPHSSLEVAFGLSIDRLSVRDRHLYAALTIFPEDEQTPPMAVEKLWGELSGLTARQVRRLLHDLADRALVQMASSGNRRDAAISLHDLLRDLMALELGETGALAAHQTLLTAYQRTQTGVGWHTAPDDGYLYRHLAYHLEKLAASVPNAAADLAQLFTDDEWMRVRVTANDYQYDGFLADLNRTWKMVQNELSAQISHDDAAGDVGQSARYALIRASINTLSGNYLPILVGQAVKTGLWSATHGLSVAAKVPDTQRRVFMFATVLGSKQCDIEQYQYATRTGLDTALAIQDEGDRSRALAALAPNLQGEMKEDTLRAGLDAALAIQDGKGRLSALTALAPNLQGEMKENALRAGLDAALAMQDEGNRSRALATLAPYLQGKLLSAGLDAALAIRYEGARMSVLAALAPNLQGELLRAGLDAALAIRSKWARSRALAALAPNLQGEMKEDALCAGLDAALAIQSEKARLSALAALAPNLQGELLRAGLDATLAIQDEGDRSRVLATLTPNLQGEMRENALRAGLDAALAIRSEGARSRALAALAPYLQGEMKENALRAGLGAALAIPSEWARSRALADLAPNLQGEMKENALRAGLDAALVIQSNKARLSALAALTPYLQGKLLRAGLDAALSIQDEEDRSKTLAALTPNLQGEMKENALRAGLDAALAIPSEWARSRALADLAPYLQGELLRAGLDAALAIPSEWARSRALADLAPNLQGEMKENALRAGLDAALAIPSEWARSRALVALAPYLQDKVLQAGLDAALSIQDEEDRSRMLAALAPNLQGELLSAGLDAALSMRSEGARSRALAALAPNLQGEMKGDALRAGLDTALAIQSGNDRLSALAALAPYLQGEMKVNALRAGLDSALAIQNEKARSRGLAALAPYLQGELLRAGLDAALAIQDEGAGLGALAALAPYLQGEMKEDALRAGLDATLAIQDGEDRSRALADLAPYLQGEMKENALRAGLNAALIIQDEKARLSALADLAPYLQGEMKEDALRAGLDATLAIQDEGNCSRSLAALAPHFQGELLRAGLEAALAIQDEEDRSYVLAALAPNLQGELLRAGLEAALAIQDEWDRSRALAALAPNLQGEMKENALRAGLDAALAIPSERDRLSVLAALAGYLQGEMKENALRAGLDTALAIQNERVRLSALAAFAPYLQGEMKENALRAELDAALAIQDERARLSALAALAANLTDPAHLRRIRRQVASDLYTEFHQSYRANLLNYLATPGLIAPPIFTPDEVAAVAEAIVDVTTKWRWL